MKRSVNVNLTHMVPFTQELNSLQFLRAFGGALISSKIVFIFYPLFDIAICEIVCPIKYILPLLEMEFLFRHF